ncbi:MAG: hypothetical protein N2595_05415 [bacterium]|nr:hypothetical protein [bacterium]
MSIILLERLTTIGRTKMTTNGQNNQDDRNETVLMSQKVVANQKLFYLDLKENERGKFLKISEKDGRFRSTIMIPEEVIADVAAIVQEASKMVKPQG